MLLMQSTQTVVWSTKVRSLKTTFGRRKLLDLIDLNRSCSRSTCQFISIIRVRTLCISRKRFKSKCKDDKTERNIPFKKYLTNKKFRRFRAIAIIRGNNCQLVKMKWQGDCAIIPQINLKLIILLTKRYWTFHRHLKSTDWDEIHQSLIISARIWTRRLNWMTVQSN